MRSGLAFQNRINSPTAFNAYIEPTFLCGAPKIDNAFGLHQYPSVGFTRSTVLTSNNHADVVKKS